MLNTSDFKRKNCKPDDGKLKDILMTYIYSSWQNLVKFTLEHLTN